jgi:hypothetical protein
MSSMLSTTRGDRALLEVNRQFYDALWADARLIEPERFNTLAAGSLFGPVTPARGRAGAEAAPPDRRHTPPRHRRTSPRAAARARSERGQIPIVTACPAIHSNRVNPPP